jgi:hypothetical protein
VTDPFDEGPRLTPAGEAELTGLCAKSPTQYNGERFPIVLRLAEKGRASEAFAARNAKGASLIGANRALLGCSSQDFTA